MQGAKLFENRRKLIFQKLADSGESRQSEPEKRAFPAKRYPISRQGDHEMSRSAMPLWKQSICKHIQCKKKIQVKNTKFVQSK
jgi:hypothetical protein